MTDLLRLSRRRVGGLLAAGAATLLAGRGRALAENPKDQGIGGTGVIGTIEGFGSILVNGLKVSYPASASVMFDGRAGRVEDLRIGHVVRLLAEASDEGLATLAIGAMSEVVGPVDYAAPTRLVVMGQIVRIDGCDQETCLEPGEWVSIHGLRQLDRSIVATRIDRVEPGRAHLAGPLRHDARGSIVVGGLPVRGAPQDLVGGRVLLVGKLTEGALQVEQAVAESSLLQSLSSRLLIEAYVKRHGEALSLGSGLSFPAVSEVVERLTSQEERALVALDLSSAHGYVAESLTPHMAPRHSGSGMGVGGPPGAPGPGDGMSPGPGPGHGEGFGPGHGDGESGGTPAGSGVGPGHGGKGHSGGHR